MCLDRGSCFALPRQGVCQDGAAQAGARSPLPRVDVVGRVVAAGMARGGRLAGTRHHRLLVALGRRLTRGVLFQALLDGHLYKLIFTQATVQTVFLAAYRLSLSICCRCSHFLFFFAFL